MPAWNQSFLRVSELPMMDLRDNEPAAAPKRALKRVEKRPLVDGPKRRGRPSGKSKKQKAYTPVPRLASVTSRGHAPCYKWHLQRTL